jgi:hypothetical protein
MLERLLTIAIIAGGAYWYWSGPYQERVNPSYAQKLRKNADNMQECMETKKYAGVRTLTHAGDVETICAKQFNLYLHEGQWHSYDDERRDQ